MKLWSFHSKTFSFTSGRVDPKRSEFAQRYPEAYQQMWLMVGTCQIVWCLTDPRDWEPAGYVEWELDVPENRLLRVVDCMIWNGILGKETVGAPFKLRQDLKIDARHKYPHNIHEQESYIEAQVKQMMFPEGDPWQKFLIQDPYDLRANILLRHPVNERWVVNKTSHP